VQKDIYFDDLTITHAKSKIIQAQDYYPFGLTFNSYQRENSVTSSFQYSGKEQQDELGLAWMDFGARMYDAQLGRWHVADPLADLFVGCSSYAYAYDNPIRFTDPFGMSNEDKVEDDGEVDRTALQFKNGVYQVGVYYSDNTTGSTSAVAGCAFCSNRIGGDLLSKSAIKLHQNLPSPAELERRFGPSFIDFFNRVVMPELKKWDEVGSMTEQEKVNAIIGIIIR
jgi:RHS repeat-associated protein